MATQSHNAALLDLEPDTLIELFEIDLGEEDGFYRFHPGKNGIKDIVFSRLTYYSLPIESTGYEVRGDGQLPRPQLTIANPQGVFSDIIKKRGDLVGRNIIRKRVYLKFLDNENFPNNINPFGVPDPESRFDDDIYKVNKKITENKYVIEFELVSPLELENVKVPARIMIAGYCPWKYRGEGCLYGQRSDHKQILPNKGIVAGDSLYFFQNYAGHLDLEGSYAAGYDAITQQQSMGRLGLPVADEKNKLFSSSTGYNLNLNWCGDFNKTSTSVTVNNGSGYTSGIQSLTIAAGGTGYSAGTLTAVATKNGGSGFAGTYTVSGGAIDAVSIGTAGSNYLRGEVTDITYSRPNPTVEISHAGNGDASITSSLTASIVVDPISATISTNRTLVFTNGGTFKLDRMAPALTTQGETQAAGTYDLYTGNGFRIEGLDTNILANTAFTFSNGSVFTTSRWGSAGVNGLSGTLSGSSVVAGSTAGVTTLYGQLTGTLVDGEAATLKYVAGDAVRFKSRFFNLAKDDVTNTEQDMTDSPDDFFVCIKTATTSTDPRLALDSWRKDQCGKNLEACRCRYTLYGKYSNGLPFGGFPSIEAYRFAR